MQMGLYRCISLLEAQPFLLGNTKWCLIKNMATVVFSFLAFYLMCKGILITKMRFMQWSKWVVHDQSNSNEMTQCAYNWMSSAMIEWGYAAIEPIIW